MLRSHQLKPAAVRVALVAFSLILLLAPMLSAHAVAVEPDPRFGAVESYLAPDRAADLNIGWDRMIIHWSRRQPGGPDQWHVGESEQNWVATAADAHREIVALLMGTPGWATEGTPNTGVPRGLYLPVDDPGNLWANFVRQVVGEYAGQIDHWIIWNEPDIAPEDYGAQFEGSVEDYYQLVKIAHQAAREVNPNAVIHLAGLTHWHDVEHERTPYLQRFLEVAAEDPSARANDFYFDVVTLHIYFTTDTVFDIIHFQRRILQRYGLNKAIWLNETNAAPLDDPQYPWASPLFTVTQDQQAAFIIQANALALAAGAERVAVYKLIDEVDPLPDGESYGLIRPDGSARPAAEALRVVTSHFADTQRVTHTQQYAYFLVNLDRGSSGVTRIAWARQGQNVSLKLRATANASSAVLYNHLGQAFAIEADRWGWYRLNLSASLCNDPNHGCIVGGAPWILVETFSDAPTPLPTATVPPPTTTQTGSAPEPAAQPTATTPPAPSTESGMSYIVQPGDNLARIARKHETTAKAIIAANDLTTDTLQIGQVLLIPDASP